MLRTALIICLLLLLPTAAPAQESWMERLGAIAIQEGGRVMPLDTYARHLAVQLTGRSRWSAERGPQAFAGRHHLQLLCDLLFRADELSRTPLVAVENRPFKVRMGLDPQQKFFTPAELSNNQMISALITEYGQARAINDSAQPTPDQRRALDISRAVNRVAAFASGEPLAIIPAGPGKTYRTAGMVSGEPGTDPVRAALHALGAAYRSGTPLDGPVAELQRAIDAAGTDTASDRAVRLELFYNAHAPWRMTAVAYVASIVVFGLSRLALRRSLTIVAVGLGLWGVTEHLLGLGLRTVILGRVPVSNTYEALLWMGLVAIAVGLAAQALARGGWYLFGGLTASLVSVLFAGLVPLQDQTNALPAVLRSNFWLTVHVLTIVASYGVLAVAAVLGHVYLIKHVLLTPRRPPTTDGPTPTPALIVQTYRTIQVGLILLTAGTILGGVWAADSWGRFWGWDPKETWALISILLYLAVLHARHIRWLRDFGLAASAVLGFVSIVWCFYGVNYVMATGLHSYGFGSGGETWVALWVAAELAFVALCRVRHTRKASPKPDTGPTIPAGAPTAA